MSITLRLFNRTDDDYESVLAIHNACFPEYQETAAEWRHWDAARPAHCLHERWLAEADGHVVAFATISQPSWMYHPRKFSVYVDVHPEYQRRGIATRLYSHLTGRVADRDPLALRTDTREDMVASTAFIKKLGFEEEMRAWESRLDLAGFDPAPYAGHEAKVLAHGIEITTLAEYAAREPAHRRKLYDALHIMFRDVPMPDEHTQPPFESWEEGVFKDENLLPDAYFLALDKGEIAGVSQLWGTKIPGVLNTGLTATMREQRRKGIALALKLRAIDYARGRGFREIRTGNESNNRPMLSINEALGFVKQPAWVNYVKHLKSQ